LSETDKAKSHKNESEFIVDPDKPAEIFTTGTVYKRIYELKKDCVIYIRSISAKGVLLKNERQKA
jgi:hypothetical protein